MSHSKLLRMKRLYPYFLFLMYLTLCICSATNSTAQIPASTKFTINQNDVDQANAFSLVPTLKIRPLLRYTAPASTNFMQEWFQENYSSVNSSRETSSIKNTSLQINETTTYSTQRTHFAKVVFTNHDVTLEEIQATSKQNKKIYLIPLPLGESCQVCHY